MELKPTKIILVTTPRGLNIWDTPRAQSDGAKLRRAEPVGAVLHAYGIFPFAGVPYAYLVPRDANKPEWCRVSEAGGTPAYVRVIELDEGAATGAQIAELTDAIRDLTAALRVTMTPRA